MSQEPHVWISKSLLCVTNSLRSRFAFFFSKHSGLACILEAVRYTERKIAHTCQFHTLKISFSAEAEKCGRSFILQSGELLSHPLLFFSQNTDNKTIQTSHGIAQASVVVSTGPANKQSDSQAVLKNLKMALSQAHSVKPLNPILSIYRDLR